MSDKIKILLFASHPTKDHPNKGIFNARAARVLSEKTDVQVINIRTWRPGRKFIEKFEFEGYSVYNCHIPHIPNEQPVFFRLSKLLVANFIRYYLKDELKTSDIYHSVGGSSNGIVAAYLSQIYGKKHVMQLNGGDINSDLPRLKKKNVLGAFPKGCDTVVGNSRALSIKFNETFNLDFPVNQIYRGVDLNNFSFSDLKNLDEGIKFLFLGGFSPYGSMRHGMNTKGGITLTEAWSKHEEALHNLNAKLTLAGPDIEYGKSWHKKLKHPENVRVLGLIKPSDIKNLYKDHHAIIIPSMDEGLPNVALESTASGRVVIASDAGGNPEIIDNEMGRIFKRGDSAELSNIILDCASQSIDLKSIGAKARQKVEKYFDHKQFAENYFGIYRKLLKEEGTNMNKAI